MARHAEDLDLVLRAAVGPDQICCSGRPGGSSCRRRVAAGSPSFRASSPLCRIDSVSDLFDGAIDAIVELARRRIT
jgi:hypothetical protein